MYTPQKISSTIKIIAQQKNVTVKKVLSDCNINKGFIYDLEHKQTYPSVEKLFRIADYFDCSVDYLLGRTKNPSCNLSENDYNQVIKAFPAVSTQNNTNGGDMALQALLHNYSGLNQAGRDRLVEYSRFVASAPEYQSADSAPEETVGETVRVFIAARSTDNTPPQWVDMPAEEVERIFNLPESDFDL